MANALDLTTSNLLSPMVLFFALGLGAALARSDLAIPEAVAKFLSIYLMMAIGFKGGAGMAEHGIQPTLVLALAGGIVLSAAMPVVAFQILSRTTALGRVDAAAVAAHYGSISIVTFLAGIQALNAAGIAYDDFMVAVAAAMEAPAILVAIWLARRGAETSNGSLHALREVALNGSVVVLLGSFAIGWITGKDGLTSVAPLITDLFKGILCLFLLDMGVIAGRGLREARRTLRGRVVLFGVYMPLIGAALGAITALLIGLNTGSTALLIVLAASSSYIAVPAAMRLALPEAKPSIYLPLSLGVTFPFNLTLGLPLYILLASRLTGSP
jgi:hypothetical protein